ncbi:xylulokinase [Paenibacillus abyssi]|uniref:Xylulokinase n=2 Tax=Paenibacillus abyssi TaxID=1340531 RepID=A0A917D0N8_9BACL|nr:FGGY family carbohydrate kinase [Paenibacillus abyssi]GGG05960.1 xylulokinase [Paenibacillus abyssi]
MAEYILAHDLGTSSHKCTAFDRHGRIAASASLTYPTHIGHGGEVEQHPSDWWHAVAVTTRKVLDKITPTSIAAISFSGHMMGGCPIGKDGTPLRASLIHADTRSTVLERYVFERVDKDLFYSATGNRIDSHYPLLKMLWLKENEPEIYRSTAYFLQAKDYLAYRMTGQLGVTDFSDASLTGIYNVNEAAWDEAILRELGLEPELLPEILPSASIIGPVSQAAAHETGLLAGTPVVLGGGDGACAAVGAGALEAGDGYINMGTTAWVSKAVRQPLLDEQQRVFTMCGQDADSYHALGTMQTAGAAYEWAVKVIGGGISYAQAEAEASRVPWGSEAIIFLPYLLGERSPIWNPHARGLFFGLDAGHTRGHLLRAVMEGIGYHLRSIADCLDPDRKVKAYQVIGGAARSQVMQHILSTVLETPIRMNEHTVEASSLGAAMMGGVAVGWFADYNEAKLHMLSPGVSCQPDKRGSGVMRKGYLLQQRLYEKLISEYDVLAELKQEWNKQLSQG